MLFSVYGLQKRYFCRFCVWLWTLTQNEILADARMKSAKADEIFGFASDEIKSTHPPSRRISSNEVGFHRQRRFHPPARVDLVEKALLSQCFFWRRWRDSNSCTSCGAYRISNPDPSTTWVHLPVTGVIISVSHQKIKCHKSFFRTNSVIFCVSLQMCS